MASTSSRSAAIRSGLGASTLSRSNGSVLEARRLNQAPSDSVTVRPSSSSKVAPAKCFRTAAVLAALGGQDRPLSALGAEYERYAASGEINSTVADAVAKVAEVRAAYPDAKFDELDGLTVELPDGAWFNLRASNTEPLLRLNVEAPKPDRMAALRDEVLRIVRS